VNIPHSEKKDLEITNYLLFHENKEQLFKQDKPLLLMHFLYLKTAGNPYMSINFMESLINERLLRIESDSSTCIISSRLLVMIDNEEMLEVEAPLCRIQVNGPIIDKLSCLEQLLLKAASVIGDIFDI
jgi:adenylate cyclase 10